MKTANIDPNRLTPASRAFHQALSPDCEGPGIILATIAEGLMEGVPLLVVGKKLLADADHAADVCDVTDAAKREQFQTYVTDLILIATDDLDAPATPAA